MKRLVIISMLSLVPLMAQQQTLLSGPFSHGGYGGPRMMVSTINGELGVLVRRPRWLGGEPRPVYWRWRLRSGKSN